MPDLPWYPWWPRHAAESFAGLPDHLELALRRALDASWSAGFHGVGTLEQWIRWGRVQAAHAEEFSGEIRVRCQVQPDGETYAHMRMVSCLSDQISKSLAQAAGGRRSAAQRASKYLPSTFEGTSKFGQATSTTRSRSRTEEASKAFESSSPTPPSPKSRIKTAPEGWIPPWERPTE